MLLVERSGFGLNELLGRRPVSQRPHERTVPESRLEEGPARRTIWSEQRQSHPWASGLPRARSGAGDGNCVREPTARPANHPIQTNTNIALDSSGLTPKLSRDA